MKVTDITMLAPTATPTPIPAFAPVERAPCGVGVPEMVAAGPVDDPEKVTEEPGKIGKKMDVVGVGIPLVKGVAPPSRAPAAGKAATPDAAAKSGVAEVLDGFRTLVDRISCFTLSEQVGFLLVNDVNNAIIDEQIWYHDSSIVDIYVLAHYRDIQRLLRLRCQSLVCEKRGVFDRIRNSMVADNLS